ncbi:MAG: hypothetical protein AAGC70_03200 [Pseudomonadota bacterium]
MIKSKIFLADRVDARLSEMIPTPILSVFLALGLLGRPPIVTMLWMVVMDGRYGWSARLRRSTGHGPAKCARLWQK